uniref:Uncharacterized protein n=1 Tax=Picea sitchensis TaxID=3332 RepID=A0A6B9XYQ3_PICSI|nr:hypothetical protein Q903MT_gene5793 [Picea sitchensis]
MTTLQEHQRMERHVIGQLLRVTKARLKEYIATPTRDMSLINSLEIFVTTRFNSRV